MNEQKKKMIFIKIHCLVVANNSASEINEKEINEKDKIKDTPIIAKENNDGLDEQNGPQKHRTGIICKTNLVIFM